MLHLAPHHVAAGADYIGVDQHVAMTSDMLLRSIKM